MEARGWDQVDIVFVSGDAYIDHPSFAAAILHRSLEAAGSAWQFSVNPNGKAATPGASFGNPVCFFAVSAGNMDSMINHYTAIRKVRNDDAYSPGDRSVCAPTGPPWFTVSGLAKHTRVFGDRGGGSRPRLGAWPITTTGPIRSNGPSWLDAKADLVVYGMG